MSQYEGVEHVVQLYSYLSGPCEVCKKGLHGRGGAIDANEHFAEAINHYLSEHDYKILHIGVESGRGDDGLEHHTTAILGL